MKLSRRKKKSQENPQNVENVFLQVEAASDALFLALQHAREAQMGPKHAQMFNQKLKLQLSTTSI